MNLNYSTDQCDSKPLGTISDNIASKSVNAKKPLSEQKLEKSNVQVIDLTTDVAFEKCIKKKKSKKLAWLEEIKKQNRKGVRTSPKNKNEAITPEAIAEVHQSSSGDEGPLNLSLSNPAVEDYHLEDYHVKISNNETDLTLKNIVEDIQAFPSTETEIQPELDVINYNSNMKEDEEKHKSDQHNEKIFFNQSQYSSHSTTDTQISHNETNEIFTISGIHENELENQLLLKIEESLLQNKSYEKTDVECEAEILKHEENERKKIDNKLPLKKRLKVHTTMSVSHENIPIQSRELESYPAIPMMSIAALESLFTQEDCDANDYQVYQKFEEKRS